MWKSKTFSNFEWCGGWNNGVMGSWTTWFLDFNKRSAWNKRGGAKFGPFLVNVLTEITVELSCRWWILIKLITVTPHLLGREEYIVIQLYFHDTHGMKESRYGDFSGSYFPVFSSNTGKCGPEKTPHLDSFHVAVLRNMVLLKYIHSWPNTEIYASKSNLTNITISSKITSSMLLYQSDSEFSRRKDCQRVVSVKKEL